jgi:hypothetical protein
MNFIALKNQSSSAGFEPANLGSNGKHANTSPPKATTLMFLLVENPFETEEASRISICGYRNGRRPLKKKKKKHREIPVFRENEYENDLSSGMLRII